MASTNLCVIGIKGSGKTHLVKTEILPHHKPVLIYDTILEYDDLPNYAVPENRADLLDLIEVQENIRVPHECGIEFEDVCFILDHCKIHYTLVVDEFHVLHDNHMSFKKEFPSFRRVILLGNHNNISTVTITQRPIYFPKDVLTQCSDLYCFYIWNKRDLDFISSVVPDADEFQKLGQFEYLHIEFVAPLKVTKGKTTL